MGIGLPYIFRVALALTVLYIVYFTLFREGKNFLFKRIYFIGAVLMSITIPMISFQVEVIVQNEAAAVVPFSAYTQSPDLEVQFADNPARQTESIIQTIWHHISQLGWLEVVWIVFALGAGVLLLRTVIGHFKIRKVVKNASPYTLYGDSVRVATEKLPPFTYFRKVVIPVNILDSPYLQAVISHERIHAKGWHCLDLYMADILCILQWFNPFAWLLKRAVRDNIEFLTDDLVTRQMNQAEYQMGMVSLAGKDMMLAFPAVSNMSQLKKRIEMMKKAKPIRYQWARVLLLMPVIALLTITLSGREVSIIESDHTGDTNTTLGIAMPTSDIPVLLQHISNVEKKIDPYFVIDGKLCSADTLDADIINKSNIRNAKVLSGESALTLYGVEPVVVMDTSNDSGADGLDMNVRSQNIAKTQTSSRSKIDFKMSDTSKVYYVFDGKIYAPGTLDLNTIKDSIKSFEVLENETAKSRYGVAPVFVVKKGERPVGPIIFEFNPPATLSTRTLEEATVAVGLKSLTSNHSSVERTIKGRSIKRVTVTKDTTQYSDKNVILVENIDNPDEPVELALSDGGLLEFVSASRVILTVPNEVLYMVDGKKVASLNNLEADIVSFAILKKEKAIELYGDSGENGVVAVKTK